MKNLSLKSTLKLLTTCLCLAFTDLATATQPGYLEIAGWTVPSGSIAGYNIYMSNQSGVGFRKVNTNPITSTAYTIKGVEAGKMYFFTITMLARQDGKLIESRPSQEFSRMALALPDLSAHDNFGTHIEATRMVTKVNPPVGGYTMYMSKIPLPGYVPVPENLKDSKGNTDGSTEDKRYYYKITSSKANMPVAVPKKTEAPIPKNIENPETPTPRNIFFGYGAVSASTRWGTPWNAQCDNGQCGTRLKFPAKGASPVDGDGVRLAGHLGMGNGWGQTCSIVSFADIGAKFLPDASPISLLAKGLPNHGLRLRLKLGPYHPAGHQDYVVMLTRSSITPDPAKNIGSDYVYIVKGSDLKSGAWTEISAPFPREGYAERQPSKFFAQADWIAKSEVHTWGTQDFTFIGFAPVIRDMNFDLSVGGIAFY